MIVTGRCCSSIFVWTRAFTPNSEIGYFNPDCANFRFQLEFPNKMLAILPFDLNVFNIIRSGSINPVILNFNFLKLGTLFQDQFSKLTYRPICNYLKDSFIFRDHQAASKEKTQKWSTHLTRAFFYIRFWTFFKKNFPLIE
jgi:hypothetical protein